MSIRSLRFVALILAALALGMHLAHALELPAKLRWDPALYLAVQTSLYGLFGTIGPVFEVGALGVTALIAFRLRGRGPAFGFTLVPVITTVLALALWAVVVMQANTHIGQWQASQVMPPDWMRWRAHWQYGQAAIFVLHVIGFSALVWSVLRETAANGRQ